MLDHKGQSAVCTDSVGADCPLVMRFGLDKQTCRTFVDFASLLTGIPNAPFLSKAYTHKVNGRVILPPIVPFHCKTELITYIPTDKYIAEGIKKAIILVRGAHSHPLAPDTKPTFTAGLEIDRAMEAAAEGPETLTANKLRKCKYSPRVFF